MRRVLLLATLLSCAGGAVTAAQAQKVAPLVTRDSDRDGVPDIRDRCRDTPAGTRVDANGCPLAQAAAPAQQAAAPATQRAPALQRGAPPAGAPTSAVPAAGPPNAPAPPTQVAGNAAPPKSGPPPAGLPTPVAPGATPGPVVANQSAPPAGAPPAANRPASPSANPPANTAGPTLVVTAPSAPVAVQPSAQPAAQPAAQPSAQPPAQPAAPPSAAPSTPAVATPPAASAMTGGFGVPNYAARTDAARLEYGRMLTLRLDSAVVALVETFRGTTGMPVPGASSPDMLTMREKRRWTQCRLIAYDLAAMSDAVREMKNSIPGGASLSRAALNLADALGALVATGECDNVGSMIEAPDRWAPWQSNYETSVRNFFRDWYGQARAVHEADRAFARALNPALPPGRQFPVPAGLPPTPPTVGGGR